MKKLLFASMILFSQASLAYADPVLGGSARAGIFQSIQDVHWSSVSNLAIIQQVPISLGGGGSVATGAIISQGIGNVINSTVSNEAEIIQAPVFIASP
jgi:hypothetical protein